MILFLVFFGLNKLYIDKIQIVLYSFISIDFVFVLINIMIKNDYKCILKIAMQLKEFAPKYVGIKLGEFVPPPQQYK